MSESKLTLELVPQTCWFSNVRAVVTKARWDIIRKQVASAAYDMCQICGGVGPKHPVECHEIWHYDDKNLIQKLTGMIALCPACHMVKHIGFARVRGKEEQAIHHLMKINKMTRKAAEAYVSKAFECWRKRSQQEWKLDISVLKDYGIDIAKIKKP